MKSKKTSGDIREDSNDMKGKKKHKLTPIKKQKSKRTQFLDEIEDFDDELDFKSEDFEDLFEDLEDYDEEEEEDF